MTWRVSLMACHDGTAPDSKYAEGLVIRDRLSGAFDLIAEANARWGTTPIPGEVYSVEPVTKGQIWRVVSPTQIEPA